MKILAIVITYNGMQWYDRCFSSLKSSTIPLDIFVCDNNSTDGTVEFIKTNFSDILLYKSEINLGFGQATNKGMRYALDTGYDFVFLLNQDAWLAKNDSVEQLVKAYFKYPQFAIISPMQLYGNGREIINSLQKTLINSDNTVNGILSDLFFGTPLNNVYPVNYVSAAAWLIPGITLQNIGGFDPLFFHYGEDDNYMQRVLFHNYEIGVCPYSAICHDIENRTPDYGKKYNNWEKNILVEFSDINNKLKLERKLLELIYSFFIKLVLLKFKSAKRNFRLAVFLLNNLPRVKNSYLTNRQKGPNWL